MKRSLIVALLLTVPVAAIAQTTAPAPSGIEWGQTVDQVVVPLIIAVIGFALKAGLTAAVVELQKRTGIAVKQAAVDRVTQELTNYAGMFIAHGEANILNATVTTGSPGIDDLANKMLAAIPGELQQAGITPATVPSLIVGAIGKLQALTNPASASSTIVAPLAQPSTMDVSVSGDATVGKTQIKGSK